MPRVPGDGVSLAAHEWPGTGPAIVCIHGLTANHVCWLSMVDLLAGKHRLIGYDLRGRGDSDKPPTGYSLDQHGRDLLALLDHFGLKKAVLMGHSLGAHIALKFSVAHPERVSKLVLVDGGIDVRAEIAAVLVEAVAHRRIVAVAAAAQVVADQPVFRRQDVGHAEPADVIGRQPMNAHDGRARARPLVHRERDAVGCDARHGAPTSCSGWAAPSPAARARASAWERATPRRAWRRA